MTNDQTMLFKRLIEYAHRQAMMRNGQIAQDIRVVLNDAARYWHLRDESNPDTCRYYLASDDPASKFNDPAHVDKSIDTDRANVEAKSSALRGHVIEPYPDEARLIAALRKRVGDTK